MKFSFGFGLGPLRVSQRLGLPRSTNSRPGYFAQFETCTVKHRTIDAENRCGRRHPNGVRAREQASSQSARLLAARRGEEVALTRSDRESLARMAQQDRLAEQALHEQDAARRARQAAQTTEYTRLRDAVGAEDHATWQARSRYASLRLDRLAQGYPLPVCQCHEPGHYDPECRHPAGT